MQDPSAQIQPADIHGLLQDMVLGTPEIASVMQANEETCAVFLLDERCVLVEWQSAPPGLVLSASLGAVPETRQQAAYATLLSFNWLWRETGGIRMCLGGVEGEVFMVREHRFEATPWNLRSVLMEFIDLLPVWVRYVMGDDTDDVPPPLPMLVDRA